MSTTWKWNVNLDLWFGVPTISPPPPKVIAGRAKQLKPLFPFTQQEVSYWNSPTPVSLIYRFILSSDFAMIRDVNASDAANGNQTLTINPGVATTQYWIIIQTQRVFSLPGNTLDYTVAFCLLKGLVSNVPIT